MLLASVGAPAEAAIGSGVDGLVDSCDCEAAFTVVITGEPGVEEETGAVIDIDFTCGVTIIGAVGADDANGTVGDP
jgi:hypothetical protein